MKKGSIFSVMKVWHHRRTWFLNCELVSNKPNLQKGFQNFNLRSQRFILKKFCIWIIFSLSKFDRISFVAHYGEVASSLCYIRKLPDRSTGSEDDLLHDLNVTDRLFVQLFSKISLDRASSFQMLFMVSFPAGNVKYIAQICDM